MKNLAVLVSLLSVISIAPVLAAVVDSWSVDKVAVGLSTAKKEDGSVVTADPALEVLLNLKVKTRSQYGNSDSRSVKSKVVTAPAGNVLGTIKLELESDSERQCADLDRGGLGMIGMVGPATSDVRLVLKPGIYHLFIDSLSVGLVNVVIDAAQFSKDPNYDDVINARSSAETIKIFGDIGAAIEGKNCKVEFRTESGGVFVDYIFPSTQETLENGDVLIRKEVKGSEKIISQWITSSCQHNRTKKSYQISWKMQLRTDSNGSIEYNRYSEDSPASARFSIAQKYCSKIN